MEKLETGFTKSEHYCSSEIPLSVFQKEVNVLDNYALRG